MLPDRYHRRFAFQYSSADADDLERDARSNRWPNLRRHRPRQYAKTNAFRRLDRVRCPSALVFHWTMNRDLILQMWSKNASYSDHLPESST